MQHARQGLGRHGIAGACDKFHEIVQLALVSVNANPDRFRIAGMRRVNPAIGGAHMRHVDLRRQTPERGRIKSRLDVSFQQRKEV